MVFIAAVIIAVVVSLMMTPIYRASSSLLVKTGREDMYVSPMGGSQALVDYSAGPGQKVNSEIAILKSQGLVTELVKHLGVNRLYDFPDLTLKERFFKEADEIFGGNRIFNSPDKTLQAKSFNESKNRKIPPIEKIYKSVEQSLDVSALPNSNVINVRFEWPDRAIAAEVVNTLIDLYLLKHIEVHKDPQTYNLLEAQVKEWEKKLRKSENGLDAFKHRHSITSLPQQKTILLGDLSEAESQKSKTESEIQENLELIGALEAQLSHLDETVRLQEEVKKDSETITALKMKLVDLELQGLKEEIKRVKQMIAQEEKKEQVEIVSGQSPIRQTLKGDLLRAKARLEALRARKVAEQNHIDAYREKLRNLDGVEKRLKKLERQTSINEANYELYLTKFNEAKISKSMDKQRIANIGVIEPAVPPLKPSKPKKRRNVLLGVFLGLFAGLGMAFVIEFIHPVFRTREDVDQFLGLPVLATLPKEK
jgi:uncharacterized protein involved in exopolysaccharide biosynthesis